MSAWLRIPPTLYAPARQTRTPDSRTTGRKRRLLRRPAAEADCEPPHRVRPRALGLIARADCSQSIRVEQDRWSAALGVSAPKPCGIRARLGPPRCVAPRSRTTAGTCRSSRLAGRAQPRSRCSQRFGAETPSVHRNLTRARQPSSGAMPFSSPRPSVRAETTLPAQLGNLQPSRAISASSSTSALRATRRCGTDSKAAGCTLWVRTFAEPEPLAGWSSAAACGFSTHSRPP
jgi:hypothetical protein